MFDRNHHEVLMNFEIWTQRQVAHIEKHRIHNQTCDHEWLNQAFEQQSL